jgi:sigma-B regulation protein RsbU (phosphoserine phosphatase)
VDLLEISRQTIENLLSRQPTVAYEMLMLLSRRLSESNQRNINDLKEKNAQLAQAYEELQLAQRQVIAQGIMDREIRQARDLQRSLLPGMLPRLPGFDLGARMIPSSMVGGDFYDVIRLDADHVGLAVGDVAGKGVPAAMFMFLACSLLRSEAHLHASPSEVLNLVNKHLRMANPRGLFVTVLYGVLHLSRSEFTYARAGHERPLIWKEDGEVVLPSEGLGQPLGVFENPSFDVQTVHLPLGSTLVIFTDGITEAHNSHDDIFGEECLQELVPELLNLPAQEFCDRLVALLDQFYGGGNRSDDITVLAVKTMP